MRNFSGWLFTKWNRLSNFKECQKAPIFAIFCLFLTFLFLLLKKAVNYGKKEPFYNFDLVPGMLNQHPEKYLLSFRKINQIFWKGDKNSTTWVTFFTLTAVFFETGAMLTPTKSQNPTNCGWGCSFQSYWTHS